MEGCKSIFEKMLLQYTNAPKLRCVRTGGDSRSPAKPDGFEPSGEKPARPK
ncbi:MAG: hypothetical protein P1P63_03710 [Treponemataceae bacterium]